MLNDTPQWVALYTNPRAEKKTCQNLQELGYEAYVPLQRKLIVQVQDEVLTQKLEVAEVLVV